MRDAIFHIAFPLTFAFTHILTYAYLPLPSLGRERKILAEELLVYNMYSIKIHPPQIPILHPQKMPGSVVM